MQNSYNFHQHYWEDKAEKMEAIMNCLDDYPEGIKPKRIAFHTGYNQNTVRTYIRELKDKGYVSSSHGIYRVVKLRDGTNKIPPRIHNIHLSINLPQEKEFEHEVKEILFDNIKIRFTIGSTHKRVTVVISSNKPLGYREFILTISIVKKMIHNLTDVYVNNENIFVKTCEFNKDDKRIRMDGCEAITVTMLTSELKKIYNKETCLRNEIKVRNLPLEAVFTFLSGNVQSFEFIKKYEDLSRKVDVLIETNKYQNRCISDNGKFLRDYILKNNTK